jgi:prepilin-type N-terminal cleavage/methylation domain-containing protein
MIANKPQTNTTGFTLAEIMIVVAIIGLLAAIAVPSFTKARNSSQQNACVNNLRVIADGKEQAAFAHRLSDGAPVAAATVKSYIRGETPTCPGGGTYTYGVVGSNPDCSITSPTAHNYAGE